MNQLFAPSAFYLSAHSFKNMVSMPWKKDKGTGYNCIIVLFKKKPFQASKLLFVVVLKPGWVYKEYIRPLNTRINQKARSIFAIY